MIIKKYKQNASKYYDLLANYSVSSVAVAYNIVTYENANAVVNEYLNKQNIKHQKATELFIYPFNLKSISNLSLPFPSQSSCKLYVLYIFDFNTGFFDLQSEEICFADKENFDELYYNDIKERYERTEYEAKNLENLRNKLFSKMVDLQVNLV